MGQEATCTVHVDGQTSSGKARLETEEIVFRGDFRLAIPLREVRDARAVDGRLTVHSAVLGDTHRREIRHSGESALTGAARRGGHT